MASSVMDYIFRRLALDHLSYDQRAELGILSVEERSAVLAGEDPAASSDELDRAGRGTAGAHRRCAAVPELRHEDAARRQLLRLRRLRLHQRLQLKASE